MIRIAVAAGGTAGHLFPGIAVAEILRSRQADVLFLGRKGGPEEAIVMARGFSFQGLSSKGRGPGLLSVRNANAALHLTTSVVKCLGIFARWKPSVVMGAGGYVSLAPALAAALSGIPIVIHEQNAVPGLANKIARRFAARVAVSFPGTESQFGDRAVLTGNPVRSEISEMDKASSRPVAYGYFDLDPGKRTLLVSGGSQGALYLNDTVAAAYDHWRRLSMQILHLAGQGKAQRVNKAVTSAKQQGDLLSWRVLEYCDRMDLAYAAADLAVCRAGASTVAELAAVGLPAILVPLPISLDDDQRRNAEAASASGGTRMVLQAYMTPGVLARLVEEILLDEPVLNKMSDSIRSLARPGAATQLADLVWEAAKLS